MIKKKLPYSFVFLTVFLLFSCDTKEVASIPKVENEQVINTVHEKETNAIREYVSNLSIEQRIAQLFLVSVDGTRSSLSATTYPVPPGGYILFSRNTADGAENIITLIGDTITHYSDSGEALPYFSIDHEGGIVNRLRGVASTLPSARQVSKHLDVQTAEELYGYSAMQLRALGIHVNIGPMAEAGYASNMTFTDTRSYGNREQTVLYSTAFLNGFRNNGIYCVVKHFPGNTNDDPHYFLPKLKGDKDMIQMLYVDPFSSLIANDGLLMSHVVVPAFDESNPACLSPTLIHDLVKTELQFNGLIFSDDILMDALLENGYPPEVAISMALKAGVNVLMISHPAYWNIIPIVLNLVENDPSLLNYINTSVEKIINAKVLMGLYEFCITEEEGKVDTMWLQTVSVNSLYNVEKQLYDFYTAKDLGNSLYNTYWGQ